MTCRDRVLHFIDLVYIGILANYTLYQIPKGRISGNWKVDWRPIILLEYASARIFKLSQVGPFVVIAIALISRFPSWLGLENVSYVALLNFNFPCSLHWYL